MGNYTELQTRVTRRVIDLPSAVVAEVPQLVNEALTKLQEAHNFKVMEAEMAAYTQALTHNVLQSVGGAAVTISPFPAGTWKEWRGEPWMLQYTDGSPRFMSIAPSREAIWGQFNQGGAINSDIGPPALLLAEMPDQYGNHALSVYPLADGASDYADGEYRITIPYYQYLPQLSAGTDNNWITNQPSGERYIVERATAEAFGLNWDWEKFQVYMASSEKHMKDVIKADKIMRLGPVREWAPHWRGVHSTKTRI